MKAIMANVWGKQTEVMLGTWEEIKKLGFKKRDRSFGHLNDGTPGLYFYKYDWESGPHSCEHDWYVTTEKLEDIND